MVQKSDAMVQYEKSAGELMKNRPKYSDDKIMHMEVRNFVAAGIFVVLIAAATMMGF